MKFDTPGSFLIEAAAMPPRSDANGVNSWPMGSTIVRFQVTSAEARVYSPGMPRSRQLAGVLNAGSAVVGVHRLLVMAFWLMASNSAESRLRLIRLARYDSSPPRIGWPNTY